MRSGNSFPENVDVESFERAELIEYLKPEHIYQENLNQIPNRTGQETWSCAWSKDGTYLAWSSGQRTVRLIPCYSLKENSYIDEEVTGKHIPVVIDAGELVWSVAFGKRDTSTGGSQLILVTGLKSGRIRIWGVPSGKPILDLVDHNYVVTGLCFANDNSERLLSSSRDGTLKVWQLKDHGNMVATLKSSQCSCIYDCTWSPDSKIATSVGDRKSVIVWDMVTYKQIRRLEGHNHNVSACAFSGDGALLVTASYDTKAIVWDPYTGNMLHTLGHMFPAPSPIFSGGANGSYVRAINFSPDGRHIVSACDDSYIRFWDIFNHDGKPKQICKVENALCVSYSSDGYCIAVGNRNGTLSLWKTPKKVSTLQELSRTSVRKQYQNTELLQSLDIAQQLKPFLAYRY